MISSILKKINNLKGFLVVLMLCGGLIYFLSITSAKAVPGSTITFLNPSSRVVTELKIIKIKVDLYKLDFEMRRLFDYIKTRNRRVPIEVVKIIAWEIITQARESNTIDVGLLVGIIETESTFHPMARSRVGAKGLMQVLIETGVEINQDKVYDIKYNIQKGIEIFNSKLRKSKGNLNLALRYYVGDKYTNKYPTKVEKRRKRYNQFLESKG